MGAFVKKEIREQICWVVALINAWDLNRPFEVLGAPLHRRGARRWPGTLHQKSCISYFQSQGLEERDSAKMEEMI